MNNSIEYVYNFLVKNGFEISISNDFDYIFTNEKCKVKINETHYSVQTNDSIMYSDNLNIYWLIGVLTYYNYMDRNYKTNFENETEN